MNQIERIKQMEKSLEESSKAIKKMLLALDEYEAAQGALKKICDYYSSANWIKDYEADEEGKLPKSLKRGVLAQDTIYDLLQDNHEITTRLLKIIAKNIEGGRC